MKANESIEVTKEQYNQAKDKLGGIVFTRQGEGKYYIKVALNKHVELVKKFLSFCNL